MLSTRKLRCCGFTRRGVQRFIFMTNSVRPADDSESDTPIFEEDSGSARLPGGASSGASDSAAVTPVAEEPIFARKSGEAIDDARARIFPCEQCGADLKFDIDQQSQKCPYCGYVKQIVIPEDAVVVEQDFQATLQRLAERRKAGTERVTGEKEIHCSTCGANVIFSGTLTSSECSYCGKPIQRENIHDAPDRVPVDGMLPFLVDGQIAGENLRQWVQSRWFAPNEFKKRGADGKFNGVYLPFFTFDALTFTRYRGERGEHYTVTTGTGKDQRTHRRTRWYPAAGEFERFFDDVLILAAKGMNRNLMHALEPWPFERIVPFNQEMVAGFLARTYDIELEAGLREARERIEAEIAGDVRRRIGGDTQQVHAIQTTLSAITYKHLLLPAWLLTYRYQDKPFQVFVNATTGEVQGERPYSWVKIVAFIAAMITLVGLVALTFSAINGR